MKTSVWSWISKVTPCLFGSSFYNKQNPEYQICKEHKHVLFIWLWLRQRKKLPSYYKTVNVFGWSWKKIMRLFDYDLLGELEFIDWDIVLYCGANIGELGLYFKIFGPEVDCRCFDSLPGEFECLILNLRDYGKANNIGLWSEEGQSDCFICIETADSSLIKPNRCLKLSKFQ